MSFDKIITGIISAITAIIVVFISDALKKRKEKKEKSNQINLTYLNPLRLYLEETYIRLNEIINKIEQEGRVEALQFIADPRELSDKKEVWFVNDGVYLVSSCYFTACLFSTIKKVREDIPYLRLKKKNDAQLLNLMFKVNLAFLKDFGIYYAIQHSIGEEMINEADDGLVTYREFCEKLKEAGDRVWFDRLINFYIESGSNNNIQRLRMATRAIRDVSSFLDTNIKGSSSIQSRLKAEGLE